MQAMHPGRGGLSVVLAVENQACLPHANRGRAGNQFFLSGFFVCLVPHSGHNNVGRSQLALGALKPPHKGVGVELGVAGYHFLQLGHCMHPKGISVFALPRG